MKPYVLFDYSYQHNIIFRIGEWYDIPFFDDCEVFDNLAGAIPTNFNVLPGQKKIVLVDWMVIKDILDNPKNYKFNWADLVIVATTEQADLDFAQLILGNQIVFDNPNTIYLLNGIDVSPNILESIISTNKVQFPTNCFFATVASANDPVIYTDEMMATRPYLFEALVGSKKPPRSYVYYRLRDSNLLDKSLVNLTSLGVMGNDGKDEFFCNTNILSAWNEQIPNDYRSPALDQEIEQVYHYNTGGYDQSGYDLYERKSFDNISNKLVHTSQQSNMLYKKINKINKINQTAKISEVIPTRVYQNSWFSLICETNLGINSQFATEKTAKVFFGKRVFIFFGSRGHLQHVRNLGFKTFDGIVDETYDTIVDDAERFDMAWQQVVKLSTSDPVAIYQQANEILEHNFQLATDIKTLMMPSYNFIQQHLARC